MKPFSEGTHFFPKNISEEQYFENAKKDAIKNIMNKAGYSYLSNRENLICTEVNEMTFVNILKMCRSAMIMVF